MGGCWRISRLLLHHLHEHQAPTDAGRVCGVVAAFGFAVLVWLCWLGIVLSVVGLVRFVFVTRDGGRMRGLVWLEDDADPTV